MGEEVGRMITTCDICGYKEETMQYEYTCIECGYTTTEFKPVANRFDEPQCESCGEDTFLAVSTVAHPVMNSARPVKKPHNQ